MICFEKNGLFKVVHYHLTKKCPIKQDKKCDVVIYSDLDSTNDEDAKFLNLQKTFVFNLSGFKDEEEIKSNMCSTIKNNINFCKSHGVIVEFFEGDNISLDILNDFINMLKKMSIQKRLKSKIVKLKTLRQYMDRNNLILSRTVFNTSVISYHVYLADGINCVLWFSCSLFRGKNNNVDRNFVGKCNRFHHFEDICYFYKKDYLSYDWGGVSSFENPNGIDNFKFSFPGEKITKYEILKPLSFRGKIYMLLKGYKI